MLCASLAALTAIVLAITLVWNAGQQPQADAPRPPAVDALTSLAATTASHPIYRYSVISGGAHNRHELLDAIGRDPVVAEHYRTVSLERVRVEKLSEARRAYVSYRVGDRVFWTKHRVTLPAGEPILTDGMTQIRARCGNCISYEAQLPTSDEEPDAVEFEALAPAANETAPSRIATHGLVPPVVTPGGRTVLSDLPSPAAIGPSSNQPLLNAPALANAIPSSGRRPTSVGPSLPDVVPVPDGPAPRSSDPEDLILRDSILGSSIPGGHTPAVPVEVLLYPPIPGTLIPRPAPSNFTGHDLLQDVPMQPVPVPEPSTIVLLGTGVAGALWRRVRRRRRC